MNLHTHIVNMIIKIGEKQPKVTNKISMREAAEAFTSSPCLLHDCLTFIGVSFVINSYIKCKLIIYTYIYNIYNLTFTKSIKKYGI